MHRRFLGLCFGYCLILGNATALAAPPTDNYYRIALEGSARGTIGEKSDDASGLAACTLRDALEIANNALTPAASPVNGCAISAVGRPTTARYVIGLPTDDYVYTLVDQLGQELEITDTTVYLLGPHRDPTRSVIQAADSFDSAKNRVLGLFDAQVEIANVILRHGRCTVNVTSCGQNVFTNGGGVLVRRDSTLTLDNARVQDSFALDGGGGIQVDNNSTLTLLNDSVVSGNTVQQGSAFLSGGGIQVRSADSAAIIDASSVRDNTVGSGAGGGINNLGSLTIRNGSRISGNTADGNGGGIAHQGEALSISDSTVADNTTSGNGGGLYTGLDAGPVAISASLFGGPDNGNEASVQGVDGRGGGIYNSLFTVVNLSNTTLSHNRANYGGGMANLGEAQLIEASLVAQNQGTFSGGGIHNSGANARLTVDASRIRDNSMTLVSGLGGGIANDGEGIVEIRNASLIGGAGTPNEAGAGGGIHNFGDDSELTVDASVVAGNEAGSGGGIYNDGGRVWVQSASEIGTSAAPNTVTGSGGGILNQGSGAQLWVNASTVQYNTARFNGGGLSNREQAELVIENASLVQHNQVTGAGFSGGGGGLYNEASGASAVIRDSHFIANHSASHGGAAFNGGGLISDLGANLEITRSLLIANSARSDGGALRNTPGGSDSGASTTITDSVLRGNRSDDNGDAINNRASASASASAVVSVGGSCFVDNGVGFYNDGAPLQDARNNWWGAADGPGDADGLSGATGSGDGVSAGVVFLPFLSTPPALCEPTILIDDFESG